MLANIFTKSIRDRWVGLTIGGVSIALFLLYGMSVYREIDLSLYTDLPDAIRELFGYSEASDVGGLAYGAVYTFFGAVTLAGLAISIGAGSIAGEERNGTIGLLLANPRSRSRLLLAKAGSLFFLLGAGSLILWTAGVGVPAILGVDVSAMDVEALVLHIFAISLFFGTMAMMIGAATGNRTLASGISAGVLLVSYLAVSTLPFVEGWSGLARIFPWYYYSSAGPVHNGADWAHLAALFGSAAAFLVASLVTLNRRDLREQGVAGNLVDRLRANPLTGKAVERLAGSARVSGIWTKAVSDRQGLLIVTGILMFLMALMMGPMYTLIDEALLDLTDDLPDALLAMVGNGDLSRPEGWYQVEMFSITTPLAMLLVTVLMGAGALAGEEAERTMGLLLANPIKRGRIVLEKAAAMLIYGAVVGVSLFLGTLAGSGAGGLGMSPLNVAAACVLATLVGTAFGGLALCLSAATGRVKVAAFGTTGVALVTYLLNSFLPLSESVAELARLTPFYYYLTSDPLVNGMRWSHAAVLLELTFGLVWLSVVLFDRRDLRQTG